jgi:hypothetical protein
MSSSSGRITSSSSSSSSKLEAVPGPCNPDAPRP